MKQVLKLKKLLKKKKLVAKISKTLCFGACSEAEHTESNNVP